MKRLVLHIDRLVLNGYPRAQRQAIVAGLREELVRHYSDPSAAARLSGLSNRERLHAGRVQVGSAGPRAVGISAARGVVRGIAG
jgi:hypothetical protein